MQYASSKWFSVSAITLSVITAAAAMAAPSTMPSGQTPFIHELLSQWTAWDKDGDGTLSQAEIDHLVTDPSVTGDAAAAAGSLKLITRLKKDKLPPLTRAYFEKYNEKAMQELRQESLKNAVEDTAGSEGVTAESTKPADAPAAWDRYYQASQKRLAGAKGVAWRESDYTLDHVRQGPIGDCFFVASITSLSVHRPEQLGKLVEKQADGSYRASFPGARPFTFPAMTDVESAISGTTSGDGAWLAVLEQAYGRYRAMVKDKPVTVDGTEVLYRGGDSAVTLAALTGHATNRIHFAKTLEDRAAQRDEILPKLRTALKTALADHRAITAGILTPGESSPGKTTPTLPKGIVSNHVYAVVDFDPKTDALEIWNPHGQSFTPTGKPGLQNGYTTEHGKFKLPLTEAYMFYTSFTFETDAPATQKAD